MASAQRAHGLSKIAPESSETVNSSLDLFGTAHTHTSIINGDWHEIHSVRDSPGGVIELKVPGNSDSYLDLNNSYIHLRVKVKKADGTNLDDDANNVLVTPGDNFFHSLFSSVTVQVNDSDVEYEPNYPHRAYVLNALNHSPEAKKTRLAASSGWFADSSVAKDFADMVGEDVAKRKASIVGSRELSYYGKLVLSTVAQEKLFAPGVSIGLRLQRSSPELCLMAATAAPVGGARVDIEHCSLFARRVQVNPALHKVQSDILFSGRSDIKMHLNRVKTQFHTISAGVQTQQIKVEQNGQLPNRVVVGLCDHRAKTGNYTLNPFNFKHTSVNSVELVADGIPVAKRFLPNFGDSNYARTYMNLFAALGHGDDWTNGITLSDFAGGFAFYVFNLSGDLCEGGGGAHFIRRGELTLNLGFAAETANTTSVFVLQEKDGELRIDAENRVKASDGLFG